MAAEMVHQTARARLLSVRACVDILYIHVCTRTYMYKMVHKTARARLLSVCVCDVIFVYVHAHVQTGVYCINAQVCRIYMHGASILA
jgi:hypothetical protein